MSDKFLEGVIALVCIVVAIVLHELAHGWAALALGDPTAKERRRLSLNPLRHVDPMGTVIFPGMLALAGAPVFGWAKPVPVNYRRLRSPRLGMMLVALAGPLTNFVLALVGAVAWGVLHHHGDVATANDSLVSYGVLTFVAMNLFIGVFNLLPIPPFDGSHILEGALPRALGRRFARLQKYGMLIFLALVAITWIAPGADVIARIVGPPVDWLWDRLMILSALVAGG